MGLSVFFMQYVPFIDSKKELEDPKIRLFRQLRDPPWATCIFRQSNILFENVGFWAKGNESTFIENPVLFQEDETYSDLMVNSILEKGRYLYNICILLSYKWMK